MYESLAEYKDADAEPTATEVSSFAPDLDINPYGMDGTNCYDELESMEDSGPKWPKKKPVDIRNCNARFRGKKKETIATRFKAQKEKVEAKHEDEAVDEPALHEPEEALEDDMHAVEATESNSSQDGPIFPRKRKWRNLGSGRIGCTRFDQIGDCELMHRPKHLGAKFSNRRTIINRPAVDQWAFQWIWTQNENGLPILDTTTNMNGNYRSGYRSRRPQTSMIFSPSGPGDVIAVIDRSTGQGLRPQFFPDGTIRFRMRTGRRYRVTVLDANRGDGTWTLHRDETMMKQTTIYRDRRRRHSEFSGDPNNNRRGLRAIIRR